MEKSRIITGITATGDLTIGNYIGAIKQIKNLQNNINEKREIFVFVADLHALTIPAEVEIFKEKVKNVIKIYLASGLNPRKIKLFRQSDIIGHTELFYYLLTNTNLGQLERMTQFKEKTIKMSNKTVSIPTGLFVYPVLMVADIMLYNAEFVPVGIDQKQHIELARDLIEKMNKKYDLSFNIPESIIIDNSSKIMALKKPEQKMSKSDEDKDNTIFLIDEDSDIKRKINTCLTDSENLIYFDQKKKPGISNLLIIYSSLKDINIDEAVNELKKLSYEKLKERVTSVLINVIRPIREKFKLLNEKDIEDSLIINKSFIQEIATENLKLIEKKMGIKNEKR